ncbi:hypothetical protein E4U43_005502 [Claviceps pusilla]|uniref:DUF7907 domain-containing protein n=1 Tax=Claviceps pusilla TaxID=123648 RepID=A0A9P7N2R4_9HYPO|nr:hypothetical protein E4U43_005502 [Claviceps pusilla]
MKATTPLVFIAAASSLVNSQYIQSKPFNLVVQSTNKTLHGQIFGACHTGSLMESLCLYPGSSKATTFHLNTTGGDQPGPGGLAGILTWELPSQPPIPSSMTFSVEPSTNVALPLFFPGSYNAQRVGFDQNSELNIVSYLDYTKPSGQFPQVLKHWHVCTTYYASYTYTSLVWVLGNGKPQNPTCVKVEVKQRFI